MKYTHYQLDYLIHREDGKALTPEQIGELDDGLWLVMAKWLEERGLLMGGGASPIGEEEEEEEESYSVGWTVDDVMDVREDLSEEQAREVLEEVIRRHDASIGINWSVLEATADVMFPEEEA